MLNLATLETRQTIIKHCFLYKVLNGQAFFPNSSIIPRPNPFDGMHQVTHSHSAGALLHTLLVSVTPSVVKLPDSGELRFYHLPSLPALRELVTTHRKIKGHKYQFLCSQINHGIPHLEDSMCEWCIILPISSGVLQGSVIGPLLFIFYINDITSISMSDGTLLFFADNMLLYRPIRSPVDYQHLQIDHPCEWTDLNYLQLNNSKCKFMIISRKRQPIQPHQPLTVNGTQLEKVVLSQVPWCLIDLHFESVHTNY